MKTFLQAFGTLSAALWVATAALASDKPAANPPTGVLALQCEDHDAKSNMKRLVMVGESSGDAASIDIVVTSADENIVNRRLKGTAEKPRSDGNYSFVLDKDPYAGKVGHFVWVFTIPSRLFSGGADGDSALPWKVGYSWTGTASANGDNNGLGVRWDWYCRKIQ